MSDVFKPFIQSAMTGVQINSQDINLLTQVVRLVLYDTQAGVLSVNTDADRGDLTGGDIIATSAPLTGKTFTGNVFNADNVSFTGISGDQFENGIITVEPTAGANDGNTLLVYLLDAATGLPFTPNGGNIDVTWNAGGIFQL